MPFFREGVLHAGYRYTIFQISQPHTPSHTHWDRTPGDAEAIAPSVMMRHMGGRGPPRDCCAHSFSRGLCVCERDAEEVGDALFARGNIYDAFRLTISAMNLMSDVVLHDEILPRHKRTHCTFPPTFDFTWFSTGLGDIRLVLRCMGKCPPLEQQILDVW